MGGVTVVGSANLDFTILLDRLPAEGETVGGGRFLQAWGGKGANQAVAARRDGAATTFVAAVGDDPLTRQMTAAWRAEGLDLAHLAVHPGQASTIAPRPRSPALARSCPSRSMAPR